jgi:iron complex outermembrane receptor protein
MKSKIVSLLFGLSVFAPLMTLLPAQTTGSGVITGRIFNPATEEYVGNAEVAVRGTNLSTVTASDGSYRLGNVPAGEATLTVDFTGYRTETAVVSVTPGQVATHDFTITPATRDGDKVVQLETYRVSSAREGSAKAIMDQKASMNISNVVASEAFGDVAEGNVGEFLKNLPGIQMDYVEADARTPRIRGLPAQYTSVTVDGMNMASADAFIQNNGTDNGGGAGAANRSFGFEQVSINSVDAIEVNYTTNAAQDAGGAAGNINMRTKRAFERRGRAFTFQLNGMMNSEQFTTRKTVGPDDRARTKIRPGAILEYGDVFLKNRLGIIVNLSTSNTYNQQRQFSPAYDTTPTATDTRPIVLTRIQYKDGPKFNERSTATFTADFKATSMLTLSYTAMYSHYEALIGNRTFGVSATRANLPGDSFLSWTNVPVSVTSTMSYLDKRTSSRAHKASFEYKWNNLVVTGALAYSHAINNYDGSLQDGTVAGNMTAGVPSGVIVSATRPAADSYTSVVRQTGGPDLADLANYKAGATASPQVTSDGRYANDQIYQGKLDGTYTTTWALPTSLQAGGGMIDHTWQYRNPTAWNKWNFIGPGGGPGGTWANYPSLYRFDPGHDSSILSTTGRTVAVQDHNTVADLFVDHPEYFVPAGSAADYLSSFINGNKFVREEIKAGYAMATTRLKRLTVQAGVRWEDTEVKTKDWDPLPGSAVAAAGFPINAAGVATTIPGMQFQYFSKPRVTREISYDNLFPSGSIKFNFTKDLQAQFGYSNTITRPAYNDIAGVAAIDEVNQRITLPNPGLVPQYADNYSARLAYYFEPVGSVAIGLFENDFADFVQTADVPLSQYPIDLPPEFDNFVVRTKFNLPGTTRFRGLTAEYSQALSFLPKPFDGFNVFANYTRTTVNIRAAGVSPHVLNGGFSYQYKNFSGGVNARWQDVTPYSSTAGRNIKANVKVDLRAEYKFTRNISAFLQVRNVFNVPDYVYDNGDELRINKIEYYGAYFIGGVKGKF